MMLLKAKGVKHGVCTGLLNNEADIQYLDRMGCVPIHTEYSDAV